MRGLLAGYMGFVFFFAVGIGSALLRLSDNNVLCHGHHCLVIQNSVMVALSLIGFILFCVLAHWYKNESER